MGIGTIDEVFQDCGLRIERLNSFTSTGAMLGEVDLSIQAETTSEPLALVVSREFSMQIIPRKKECFSQNGQPSCSNMLIVEYLPEMWPKIVVAETLNLRAAADRFITCSFNSRDCREKCLSRVFSARFSLVRLHHGDTAFKLCFCTKLQQ